MRTLPLDIGIGQEAFRHRVEEADRRVLVQVALVQQHHELVLDHDAVVFGGRRGVQVVAHAQVTPVGQKLGVVARRDLGGRGAFLVGAHGHGRAMSVGARDHQHVVAAQALVAREDIRRHVHAREMANVQRAVGIRPGSADQNGLALRHGWLTKIG